MSREEMITIAVDWWANKLQNVRHDNGDPASILAMMMADMIAEKHIPTEEQIDIFKRELKTRIEERLEHPVWPECRLSCDYGPCKELADAAKAAGIDNSRFPYKTHMRITEEAVSVAAGYAQPFVTIALKGE